MISFVRGLLAITDRPTHRRLMLAIAGAVGITGIEIFGLLLLVPFVGLVTGESGNSQISDTIRDVTGVTDQDTLIVVLGVTTVVAFVLKGALSLALHWWYYGVIFESEAQAAERLLDGYLHAPYTLHLRRNSAELIRNIMESTLGAFQFGFVGFLNFATEAIVVVGILALLVVVEPLASLGALVWFGIMAFGYTRLVYGRAQEMGREWQERQRDALQSLQQALGGIKEVKVRGRQGAFLDDFSTAKRRVAKVRRRVQIFRDIPRYYLETAFVLGFSLLATLVMVGGSTDESLAVLALFATAGFRILPSLGRMMTALTNLRNGSHPVDTIAEEFALMEEWADDSPPSEARTLRESIAFDRVGFTYEGTDAPVVNDITFRIGVGESVGLVGASGAGKSTCIDLLLGLHHPQSGAVLVDGIDIHDDLAAWQQCIGLVPQDVFLLDASLRSNIAFGESVEDIDEERVLEAIGLAQLEDYVDSLPEGLETTVGERGVRISGGQRQRVGIARALYLRPSVLVLDEATSSLDGATEAMITRTVEALHGRLTIITVAHRLSTIRNADRIVFLEEGHVGGVGTFDELRDTLPAFAELTQLADVSASRS